MPSRPPTSQLPHRRAFHTSARATRVTRVNCIGRGFWQSAGFSKGRNLPPRHHWPGPRASYWLTWSVRRPRWVQGGIARPSPPQDRCHSFRQRQGWAPNINHQQPSAFTVAPAWEESRGGSGVSRDGLRELRPPHAGGLGSK